MINTTKKILCIIIIIFFLLISPLYAYADNNGEIVLFTDKTALNIVYTFTQNKLLIDELQDNILINSTDIWESTEKAFIINELVRQIDSFDIKKLDFTPKVLSLNEIQQYITDQLRTGKQSESFEKHFNKIILSERENIHQQFLTKKKIYETQAIEKAKREALELGPIVNVTEHKIYLEHPKLNKSIGLSLLFGFKFPYASTSLNLDSLTLGFTCVGYSKSHPIIFDNLISSTYSSVLVYCGLGPNLIVYKNPKNTINLSLSTSGGILGSYSNNQKLFTIAPCVKLASDVIFNLGDYKDLSFYIEANYLQSMNLQLFSINVGVML